MSVSFGGLLESTATFKVNEAVNAGSLVKISASNTVSACADGDKFCGYVVSCDDKYAAVQLKGVISVPYSGTAPAVGFASLLSDGEGVKTAANGREYLVLSVDAVAGKITVLI